MPGDQYLVDAGKLVEQLEAWALPNLLARFL